MNMRGAAILVSYCRSVLAKVLGEIDCGFLDIQQRLCRRPFRINHVVAFELDMEELQFVVFPRLKAGNGRAVDQHLRRLSLADINDTNDGYLREGDGWSRRETDIADRRLYVAIGRIGGLQGSPREGPESVSEPPFDCGA